MIAVARCICLLFFLFMVDTSYAAHNPHADHIQKKVGIFTAVLVCSYGYLSFLMKAVDSIPLSGFKEIDKNLYPKAYEWIWKELGSYEVNPDDIVLKTSPFFEWLTLFNNVESCLLVPARDVQEVENLLTFHPESLLLNRYRFMIGHHAAHICRGYDTEEKEFLSWYVLSSSVFLASYLTLFIPGIINLNSPFASAEGQRDFWLGTFGIVGGIGGAVFCIKALQDYLRKKNQEADDAVCNDRAILEGGVKYLQEHMGYTGDDGNVDSGWFDSFPRLMHRINMLKKRIAELTDTSITSIRKTLV